MPRERISLGYDVVDNAHFARGAGEAREQGQAERIRLQLPREFFLASARFLEKKNLPRMLQAYAQYRQRSANDDRLGKKPPWDLVLLGDGPLRPLVERCIRDLRVAPHIRLPGFKQYEELPTYYGLASAFIHASVVDQWGLVVNEAMAAGLPVLVSDRCGCASSLVSDGKNGFTFDPYDVESLTDRMVRITSFSDETRQAMGQQSAEIIADFGLDRFGRGLADAATVALEAGPLAKQAFGSLTLRVLARVAR